MKWKTLTIVSAFFLLAGCWDIEESDRLDYVHGVGVDYKDGKVILYLQLVNLGGLGTPETAVKEEDQITIATASAEDVNTAIFNIYKSAQRRLYWGHTTFIILSEATLENNKLKEVLDLVNRYPETRYRIRMFSTNDDISELMKVSPTFKGSPIFSRLTDLNNAYEQSSWIKPLSNRELLISLDEPGYNGFIPAIRVTENTWQTESSPEPMVEPIGVASVTPEMFKGFLMADDIEGLRWMQDSERVNITIYKDGKPASGLVILNPKTTFNIKEDGNKVTFHVEFRGKGIINEMVQNVDQEFIVKEVEKKIKKEVMHTYKEALEINSDIYRLSEKLYRRNLKTWQKLEENGAIPLDKNSLHIDVNINLNDSKLNKTEPIVE